MDVFAISTINQGSLEKASFSPSLVQGFIDFVDGSKKTTETYVNNLKQFVVWTRYQDVKQPMREDIVSYRDWLSSEHQAIEHAETPQGWKYRLDPHGNPVILVCKPATIRLYMQSVKQFFKWTSANNLYPNIAEQIKTPRVRQDIHKKDAFTPSEVLAIEKSIKKNSEERTTLQGQNAKDTAGRIQRSNEQGKRLYAIYLLAVNAGLRTVELSRANVKDLEVKGGEAFLYVWGKGHSEPDQKKPLAPEVYQAVKEYLDSRTDRPSGSSPLFVSTSNRSYGKRIDPKEISKMLKRAMVEAGYNSERLTAHSLRHTAGTAVQGLTGDIYATQKYMRHTSPVTTEIYLHNETEKQEVTIAKRLYALFHEEEDAPSAPTEAEKTATSILTGLTPDQMKALLEFAKRL